MKIWQTYIFSHY